MNEFVFLLLLCAAMFFGSFLFGSIPLMFSMELKYMNLYGAGLLVGAALIVVIPEGIEVVYLVDEHFHDDDKRNHTLMLRNISYDIISGGISQKDDHSLEENHVPSAIDGHVHQEGHVHLHQGDQPLETTNDHQEAHTHVHEADQTLETTNENHNHQETHRHSHEEGHAHSHSHQHSDKGKVIGLALTFGFGMMFLIEQFTKQLGGNFHSHAHSSVSLHALESQASIRSHQTHTTTRARSSTLAAFIGLLIHCMADGIALGASSNHSMQLLIFLAILLHKAPSAFGLTTYLLSAGLTRKRTRQYLLLFCLAAPISAIITWCVSGGGFGGVLLLISGGSFLYVSSVHVLSEVQIESLVDVLVVLIGLFSPLVLSIGHHH